MRYRWLRYPYAETVSRSGPQLLIGDLWSRHLPVTLAQPQWRPSTDLYETPTAVIVKVELAGMKEEDFEEAIGVDLGLKNFVITSDGSKYDLPKKHLAKLEKNRKRKQKKLARKKDKTSNKRRKAKRLVAKVTSIIARVREDFLHKLSRCPGIRKPSDLCRRFGSQEHGEKS